LVCTTTAYSGAGGDILMESMSLLCTFCSPFRFHRATSQYRRSSRTIASICCRRHVPSKPCLGPIQGEVQASPRDTNFGGRLLLYTPSENLACGAAEVSSNGFFDVNNVPPWDIWVGFSERTLVSWVPPALIEVAQMGIYVNPEECIRWAN
jgi:hypothetical protein